MLTSQDDTTEPSYKLVLRQECVNSVKMCQKNCVKWAFAQCVLTKPYCVLKAGSSVRIDVSKLVCM